MSETIRNVLVGTGLSLLATAAVYFLFIGLNRLMKRAVEVVRSWRGTRIKDVRIQSLKLLTADKIANLLAAFLEVFRIVAILGLAYSYFLIVLSFFPAARGVASALLHYALTPIKSLLASVIGYIPKLFSILVILIVTRYAIKTVRLIFAALESGGVTVRGFYPDWARPTFQIARFFIIILAAAAIFPYLPGAGSSAFKGISVFVGVLFSLGATSATGNIIAGLVITYMRPFRIGERVKIGETAGDIIEKGLLVTRVRTIKNEEVSIPNSAVLSSHIVNYSASVHDEGLILHTTVSIGYAAPWRRIHELLISAAAATANVLKEPKPFVLQSSLGDFYISYQLNAYTDKPSSMVNTYSELHQNIQDQFNQAGIEIMSPHYTALRDGNDAAIPASYPRTGAGRAGFRVLKDGSA